VGTRALTDKAGFSLAADQSAVTIGTISNTVDANAIEILGTALTETNAGDVAESFSFFYDVDPVTTKTVDDVGVAGSSLTAADVWTYTAGGGRALTDKAGFTISGTITTLDSLETAGNAAWSTAVGFSTHAAADVWTVGTRALTDKAGFSLAADQSAVTIGTISNDVTLGASERNSIADATLSRNVSNVEGSASEFSLCYTVLAMAKSDTTTNPGFLTVFKTTGTEFVQNAITTDAAADPITGIQ
jgi:hypothetical protein